MSPKPNPEETPEKTLIAIISDVTMVALMEMNYLGAYEGVVTDQFPPDQWNRVSRVMNFVQLGTHNDFAIDHEGIVTFSWSDIRILVNRQGLYLDRRLLNEQDEIKFGVKGELPTSRRKWLLKNIWSKKEPDCGCGGQK